MRGIVRTFTGCQAVKLEGGRAMAPTVEFLVARGIPVMGHIGLMPQSVNTMGGYRARGRDQAQGDDIVEDAEAVSAAGAFAVTRIDTNDGSSLVRPMRNSSTSNAAS